MKPIKPRLYLSLCLLALTACKSTGRSKLDAIHFNSGDKSYFVNYENDLFQIYSCKSNSELQLALEIAGDLKQAKELCHDALTIVTPMAMKDAIAEELGGPASDDLIGTKTERVAQLKSQIKTVQLSIFDFENDFNNSPSDAIKKVLSSEIANFKAQLNAMLAEVDLLENALNDPSKLKKIDINSTLALQSQMASSIDDQAAVFTAMLRDSKLYKLDPKRDSIMVKIMDKFPTSCQPNIDTSLRKKARIGIEELEYECSASGEAKIIATTCALSGYERIQNYCIFTGKNLAPNKLVATHNGICAVSQGLSVSCWGEAGKFPMVENSFSEGTNTVSRTLPTTKKAVSAVVASRRQLCSMNEEGVIIRCWTNVADVPGASSKFSQIVGGDGHFCGITTEGTLSCWGETAYKQTEIPTDLSKVRSISTAENNNCAIDSNNRLACWGEVLNSTGASALSVPSNLGEVNSVSVGTAHVCVVLNDNKVQCWGNNEYGQSTVPSKVKDARLVATGVDESCAVSLAGSLQCWGRRSSSGIYKQGPELNDIKTIYTSRWGSNFCAVYGSKNSVACWGHTKYDEVYDLSPPADLSDVKDIAITASGYACAVTSSNAVRCWGNKSLVPSTVPDALIIKN